LTIPTIRSIKVNARFGPPQPAFREYGTGVASLKSGEEVETADGQTWFHPYDGGKPWKVEDRYEAIF
jgi:hypothetical protein